VQLTPGMTAPSPAMPTEATEFQLGFLFKETLQTRIDQKNLEHDMQVGFEALQNRVAAVEAAPPPSQSAPPPPQQPAPRGVVNKSPSTSSDLSRNSKEDGERRVSQGRWPWRQTGKFSRMQKGKSSRPQSSPRSHEVLKMNAEGLFLKRRKYKGKTSSKFMGVSKLKNKWVARDVSSGLEFRKSFPTEKQAAAAFTKFRLQKLKGEGIKPVIVKERSTIAKRSE